MCREEGKKNPSVDPSVIVKGSTCTNSSRKAAFAPTVVSCSASPPTVNRIATGSTRRDSRKKKNCSIYPSNIVEPCKNFCSIYPSSFVEPRTCFCRVYPSSNVEGQHMYRQKEDGLTPGLLEKNPYPLRPHYEGTVTSRAVQSAALSQLCPHRKLY